MKKVFLVVTISFLSGVVFGQCLVFNDIVQPDNFPAPEGQFTFDGSRSRLDVPITHYKWEVYNSDPIESPIGIIFKPPEVKLLMILKVKTQIGTVLNGIQYV